MHAFWLKRSKIKPVQHLQTPSAHVHGLPVDDEEEDDDDEDVEVSMVEFCLGLGFFFEFFLA